MKFSKTIECSGTPEAFTRLLNNPEYYQQRWKDLDSRPQVDFRLSKNKLQVTTLLDISEATVSSISTMLNSGMQVRAVEVWDLDAQGVARKGSMSASVMGVPAKASLTMRTETSPDDPQHTVLYINGEITCTVPLIGTSVERAVVKRIDSVIQREQSVINEMLPHNP